MILVLHILLHTVLVTVTLKGTCFDTANVYELSESQKYCLILSKSLTAEGILLGKLSKGSEVSPGFTWSARFMETAGASLLHSLCVCVIRNCRFSGKRSSFNCSSEGDSKSLSREGHQKYKMNFLASLLKVIRCVRVCDSLCVSVLLVCACMGCVC